MGGSLTAMKKSIFQRKKMEDENYEFPRTLEEFGYAFNKEGELRDIKTEEKFEFKVEPDNHRYNQARYNALGDIITRHIYKIMEKEYGLRRVYLPEDADEDEPKTLIFLSDDALTNPDKLMLIVHGSGAVRAGQWARSIIINDNLYKGSQLPYIKWAQDEGYGIIVLNTNINSVERHGEEVEVRDHSTPEEHFETIWKDFVRPAKAKDIAIVAHSYGGCAVLESLRVHSEEFWDRVFALALTDSVHAIMYRNEEKEMRTVFPKESPRIKEETVVNFYKARAMNWASAYDPLDSPLRNTMDNCPTVSAGTDKHEYTSDTSKDSVFKWLKNKNLNIHSGLPDQDEVPDVLGQAPPPPKEEPNETLSPKQDRASDTQEVTQVPQQQSTSTPNFQSLDICEKSENQVSQEPDTEILHSHGINEEDSQKIVESETDDIKSSVKPPTSPNTMDTEKKMEL